MGQQTSCKTLRVIGVHLTMHLMHPSYGLATIMYQAGRHNSAVRIKCKSNIHFPSTSVVQQDLQKQEALLYHVISYLHVRYKKLPSGKNSEIITCIQRASHVHLSGHIIVHIRMHLPICSLVSMCNLIHSLESLSLQWERPTTCTLINL